MSSTDIDIVDYIENVFNVELLEYQKILLRNMSKHDRIYMTMPHHIYWNDFIILRSCLESILRNENEICKEK